MIALETSPIESEGSHVARDDQLERSVLCAALFHKVILGISEEDFYSTAHQNIAAACNQLTASHNTVDVESVSSILHRKGLLASVGGKDYLSGLEGASLNPDHAESHARLVAEMAKQRRVVNVARRIVADGTASSSDPALFVERSIKRMHDACAGDVDHRPVLLFDVAQKHYTSLLELKGSGLKPALPWPWPSLTNATRGMVFKGVTVLGAVSGAGKTLMGWQTARHVARHRHDGKACGVLYISGEISKEELTENATCSEADVSLDHIYNHVDDDDRVFNTMRDLGQLPIFIRDRSATALDVRRAVREANSTMRHMAGEGGAGQIRLVVIDFVQMMKLGKADRHEIALTEFAYEMKAIAKEFDLHVLMLAQENANATIEGRSSNRGFKGASGLSEPADLAMFLRRKYLDKDGDADREQWRNHAEIRITKGRRTDVGRVTLFIEPERARMRELRDGEFANTYEPEQASSKSDWKQSSRRSAPTSRVTTRAANDADDPAFW